MKSGINMTKIRGLQTKIKGSKFIWSMIQESNSFGASRYYFDHKPAKSIEQTKT